METAGEPNVVGAEALAKVTGGVNVKEGSTVCIVGLKSQPELNGRHGVVGPFDAVSGRFSVRLPPSALSDTSGGLTELKNERHVKVKPLNLQNYSNLKPGDDSVVPWLQIREDEEKALSPAEAAAARSAQLEFSARIQYILAHPEKAKDSIIAIPSLCLVKKPQRGIIPTERAIMAGAFRRELSHPADGVNGFVYVAVYNPADTKCTRAVNTWRKATYEDDEVISLKTAGYFQFMFTMMQLMSGAPSVELPNADLEALGI